MNAYLKCSCFVRAILEDEIEIFPLLALISSSSTDLKRIQNSHRLFTEFGADKPLQHIGQEAELKFESNFEPEPLLFIGQSLPKAFREDNPRFSLQNHLPSSWGLTPAQLRPFGLAKQKSVLPLLLYREPGLKVLNAL